MLCSMVMISNVCFIGLGFLEPTCLRPRKNFGDEKVASPFLVN